MPVDKPRILKKGDADFESHVRSEYYAVCIYIVRNQRYLNAFLRETEGKYTQKDLKLLMKKERKAFFCSRSARARSLEISLKAFHIFCITLLVTNFDYASKFLQKFLWKTCMKERDLVVRYKGEYPSGEVFMNGSPCLDDAVDKASVFSMMLSEYLLQQGRDTEETWKKLSENADLGLQHIMQLAYISGLNPQEKQKGKVTELERLIREMVFQGKKEPMLGQIVSGNNLPYIEGITEWFGLKEFMHYKFTEKDKADISNCLATVVSGVAAYRDSMKSFTEASPEDLFKHMAEYEETMDAMDVLGKADVDSTDFDNVRAIYALGKMTEHERESVVSMFIDILPDDPSAEGPGYGLARRLQEKLNEKDTLLGKKQQELNQMQLALDRERKKNAELKDKQHQLSGSIEEMQKLLEDLGKPETHVDDIASDEKYEFPENTILFGGHPNWQRKFRLLYPSVKVYDADDMGFSADVIRNANLILLNVTHMSHKQYSPVIKAARQYHKNVEYIK